MKKIIRLIIAILCVFFAFRILQYNLVPVPGTPTERITRYFSDAALFLSEKIDALTGGIAGREDPQGEKGPAKTDPAPSPLPLPDPDSSASQEEGSARVEEADTGTTAKAHTDIPGMDIVIEEASESASEGDTGSGPSQAAEDEYFYYYYTQISREERLLYDAMLALCVNSGSGDYSEESRLISIDPSSETFAQSYTRAYNALVTDHPELFWIAQGRSHFECRYYILPSFGGQFKVIFSLPDPYDQHVQEEEELKNAADALLERVDFSLTDAQIALQIHDLLIDTAWYNNSKIENDYAHTAYGALVKDSSGNPGGALCDGYAMAYEYLLQKAGIPCTMVCGYAGESDEENDKHAWNLICLDDEWYEVDATWDDLVFSISTEIDGYELVAKALSDDDYMDRLCHSMWCLTTQQIRYFTPGEEFNYVSGRNTVALLKPSVHIRFTIDESEVTRDYVTPLAPVAEGTRYSWENVRYPERSDP